MLLKFIKSGSSDPGVGEINNEFVTWQFGDYSTADDIKGPDVGVRYEAPDLYLRRPFGSVNADEHFNARITVGGVGIVGTGTMVSMAHRASELPCRSTIG